MKSRVVIIDCDAASARVTNIILSDAGYDSVVVSRIADACAEIAQAETSLAIINVELEESDGFELTRALRAEHYWGPIIFTSSKENVACKLEAFRLGADDFIVKPFSPLELIARVNSVIRRFTIAEQNSRSRLVRVDDAELSVGKLTYKSGTVPLTVLTPTEMKILDCLMRNSGIAISRRILIERVWGHDFFGDTNRVDVYIRRIRRKIESNPAEPEYLHTARGLGYVFQVIPAKNRKHTRRSFVEAFSDE